MSVERAVTIAYMAVSVESLLMQAWALRQLWRHRSAPGLVRTAACRVGCSVLYVAVGVNAALTHSWVLEVTFAAYVMTQVTWQLNSRLDVRLARPRHRR